MSAAVFTWSLQFAIELEPQLVKVLQSGHGEMWSGPTSKLPYQVASAHPLGKVHCQTLDALVAMGAKRRSTVEKAQAFPKCKSRSHEAVKAKLSTGCASVRDAYKRALQDILGHLHPPQASQHIGQKAGVTTAANEA